MPVTRDPDVSAEMVVLFQTFNHAAEGHSPRNVLEVAFNFMVAAINQFALSDEAAENAAIYLANKLPDEVVAQRHRVPLPTDVEVKDG
jgi:hypothetical protein